MNGNDVFDALRAEFRGLGDGPVQMAINMLLETARKQKQAGDDPSKAVRMAMKGARLITAPEIRNAAVWNVCLTLVELGMYGKAREAARIIKNDERQYAEVCLSIQKAVGKEIVRRAEIVDSAVRSLNKLKDSPESADAFGIAINLAKGGKAAEGLVIAKSTPGPRIYTRFDIESLKPEKFTHSQLMEALNVAVNSGNKSLIRGIGFAASHAELKRLIRSIKEGRRGECASLMKEARAGLAGAVAGIRNRRLVAHLDAREKFRIAHPLPVAQPSTTGGGQRGAQSRRTVF